MQGPPSSGHEEPVNPSLASRQQAASANLASQPQAANGSLDLKRPRPRMKEARMQESWRQEPVPGIPDAYTVRPCPPEQTPSASAGQDQMACAATVVRDADLAPQAPVRRERFPRAATTGSQGSPPATAEITQDILGLALAARSSQAAAMSTTTLEEREWVDQQDSNCETKNPCVAMVDAAKDAGRLSVHARQAATAALSTEQPQREVVHLGNTYPCCSREFQRVSACMCG